MQLMPLTSCSSTYVEVASACCRQRSISMPIMVVRSLSSVLTRSSSEARACMLACRAGDTDILRCAHYAVGGRAELFCRKHISLHPCTSLRGRRSSEARPQPAILHTETAQV